MIRMKARDGQGGDWITWSGICEGFIGEEYNRPKTPFSQEAALHWNKLHTLRWDVNNGRPHLLTASGDLDNGQEDYGGFLPHV